MSGSTVVQYSYQVSLGELLSNWTIINFYLIFTWFESSFNPLTNYLYHLSSFSDLCMACNNCNCVGNLKIQYNNNNELKRAFLLTIIVEKSKKCLDFSVTYTTIHLLLCTIYNGFPASWDWWILNVLGMIIMTVLGEFLCSRLELKEIPLL